MQSSLRTTALEKLPYVCMRRYIGEYLHQHYLQQQNMSIITRIRKLVYSHMEYYMIYSINDPRNIMLSGRKKHLVKKWPLLHLYKVKNTQNNIKRTKPLWLEKSRYISWQHATTSVNDGECFHESRRGIFFLTLGQWQTKLKWRILIPVMILEREAAVRCFTCLVLGWCTVETTEDTQELSLYEKRPG